MQQKMCCYSHAWSSLLGTPRVCHPPWPALGSCGGPAGWEGGGGLENRFNPPPPPAHPLCDLFFLNPTSKEVIQVHICEQA